MYTEYSVHRYVCRTALQQFVHNASCIYTVQCCIHKSEIELQCTECGDKLAEIVGYTVYTVCYFIIHTVCTFV